MNPVSRSVTRQLFEVTTVFGHAAALAHTKSMRPVVLSVPTYTGEPCAIADVRKKET